MLSYWFYPNPGSSGYTNPKVILLIVFSLALFFGSFLLQLWRGGRANPVTRRLSRSWPATLRWFGGIGFLLTISRAEGVQFLSMRALWLLWILAFFSFTFFQVWKFRLRHYRILPREFEEDPRDKYLPKDKRA